MLRLVNLSFLLVLISFPAYAQAINDEGAERVKAMFQRTLDYQKQVNEMFNTFNMIYDGELQVEKKETYYAVTFPYIKAEGIPLKPLEGSEAQIETISFDLGVIKVNVSPSDKDDEWKTIWTFPSKMTLSDSSEEDLNIEFSEQKTLAVLNERLGYFTKISANFSDFSISEGTEEPYIKTGNLQIYNNFEESENGAFSGPFRLTLQNNVITDIEESSVITAKSFEVDGSFTDLYLPTLEEYLEKLKKQQKLFAELEKSTSEIADDEEGAEEQSKATQKEIDNLIQVFKEMYSFDIGGMSFNYALNGLSIVGDRDGEKTETLMDKTFFGGSFDGLKGESGSMHLKLGFSGLKSDTDKQDTDDLTPENANIDIKVDNVPYTTLQKLSENSFEAISESPENAQLVGLGLMMRLPMIMSQANTSITVDNNLIEGDLYSVKANGNASADLVAALGFTVDVKASFAGLDKVIDILNSADAESESEGQDFGQQLETLREMGQKDGDVYKYHFELTETGQFTINGADFPPQPAAGP